MVEIHISFVLACILSRGSVATVAEASMRDGYGSDRWPHDATNARTNDRSVRRLSFTFLRAQGCLDDMSVWVPRGGRGASPHLLLDNNDLVRAFAKVHDPKCA